MIVGRVDDTSRIIHIVMIKAMMIMKMMMITSVCRLQIHQGRIRRLSDLFFFFELLFSIFSICKLTFFPKSFLLKERKNLLSSFPFCWVALPLPNFSWPESNTVDSVSSFKKVLRKVSKKFETNKRKYSLLPLCQLLRLLVLWHALCIIVFKNIILIMMLIIITIIKMMIISGHSGSGAIQGGDSKADPDEGAYHQQDGRRL